MASSFAGTKDNPETGNALIYLIASRSGGLDQPHVGRLLTLGAVDNLERDRLPLV